MSIGKNLVRTTMPSSLEVLHTVPIAKKNEIRSITACNKDETSDATWYLYIRTGGSLVALIPGTVQWKIPMGRNIDYETWKVLSAGDTIEGYAAGSVDIHIDGAEVDV